MNTKKGNQLYTYNSLWIVFSIVLFLSIDSVVLAQGDLLVFPKRLVFEGRNRVERVTLSNTGKEAAIYNISFIEYRMTDVGRFERITEPDEGQHFATPYLRVFPRQVNLAPGESQTVKVQLRNTAEMIDGEYRSHLYFRAEKNNSPLGQDDDKKNEEKISVQLEAVFGISIATIIRKGELFSESSISDIRYFKDEESNHLLSFDINRTGDKSLYGDVTVNYISDKDKKTEVAKVKGLGVYTPGHVRTIKLLLQNPKNVNFRTGKLEVIFTENEKKTLLAQSELEL